MMKDGILRREAVARSFALVGKISGGSGRVPDRGLIMTQGEAAGDVDCGDG